MKQGVRIIGGLYRGKQLNFPELEGLRPTPNRVRETLFNWLMHDIRNASCLDAFAGSGALGFEAFSRGALEVTFVEQASIACAQLRKNIKAFKTDKLSLIEMDAKRYLQENTKAFDIIFLDPPFKENLLPTCIDYVLKNNSLKKGGLLYLESAQVIQLNDADWQSLKLKQTGQVVYGLFKKL